MAARVVRFVHASDFRLHEPIRGALYLNEAIEKLLIDAPLESVCRVFDYAAQEKVDFVLLSGDLLHPFQTSPRCWSVLLEQFRGLGEQGVMVYWAGGPIDGPEQWPAGIELPQNVVHFSSRRWTRCVHVVGDEPAVVIYGKSTPAGGRFTSRDLPGAEGEPWAVAVCNGEVDAEALAGGAIRYWALGGRPVKRTLIEQPKRIAHYPGTPQARTATDGQSHGCTLVEVDPDGNLQAVHVPVDRVRFCTERLFVRDGITPAELVRVLAERARQSCTRAEGRLLLIRWEIESGPATSAWMLRDDVLAELIEQLAPAAVASGWWPWALVPLIDGELPSGWYDEQSLLGDYLRAVRQAQQGELMLVPPEYLPADDAFTLPDSLATPTARRRLKEACIIGAAALRGG